MEIHIGNSHWKRHRLRPIKSELLGVYFLIFFYMLNVGDRFGVLSETGNDTQKEPFTRKY